LADHRLELGDPRAQFVEVVGGRFLPEQCDHLGMIAEPTGSGCCRL
jgi:hypothetical protein